MEWGILRYDLAILEETNVRYLELDGACGTLPFSVDFKFAGFGVFYYSQQEVERDDDEIGC